ncbi:hypothetical protein NP493_8681g00002 [Ridgeia piscesae]|uniref:Sushi domain-containing protein n=1 Tax=Ridgeia piscesae TaxID=27915 RepID=A0AAD9IQE4_RIDPI|nr:hypothetical protein NP493_8681g00002 [Ridgeia piscesae]
MQCLPGYHRVRGSLLRTCLGEGAWSGTPLECQETVCRAPTDVVGGELSVRSLTVGSTVTYRPKQTYRHVRGDLIRTCREDELWSGELPVFKEITCPAIRIGEESKVQFYTDGVVVGSTVSFSCAPGYNLTAGDATCACEITGNWSCGTPTCTRVNCGEPPVVDNGKREMTGTRYMDRATYTCDTGYYREGADSHFVCSKRAVWEGEDVVCEVTYKSRVVYTCLEGLSLVGDRERTCEANGTWSGEPPTCHSELDIQAQQMTTRRA